jgi:peptidoglycan/LPS O-acetylase OafA/YrhL
MGRKPGRYHTVVGDRCTAFDLKGGGAFWAFGAKVIPLLLWAAILLGIVARTQTRYAALSSIYKNLRESEIAKYCGSRSYSLYLGHLPAIAFCHFLVYSTFPEAQPAFTFFSLTLISVPASIAVSELLYRSIERPGILLGSRLAARLVPSPEAARSGIMTVASEKSPGAGF